MNATSLPSYAYLRGLCPIHKDEDLSPEEATLVAIPLNTRMVITPEAIVLDAYIQEPRSPLYKGCFPYSLANPPFIHICLTTLRKEEIHLDEDNVITTNFRSSLTLRNVICPLSTMQEGVKNGRLVDLTLDDFKFKVRFPCSKEQKDNASVNLRDHSSAWTIKALEGRRWILIPSSTELKGFLFDPPPHKTGCRDMPIMVAIISLLVLCAFAATLCNHRSISSS